MLFTYFRQLLYLPASWLVNTNMVLLTPWISAYAILHILTNLNTFFILSTACRVHEAQDSKASYSYHQEDLLERVTTGLPERLICLKHHVLKEQKATTFALARNSDDVFNSLSSRNPGEWTETLKMRPWTGSWRWIMLILFAWGTLLFYIGGHLVRDNDHPDHSSRELSKILAKLERLKQQNEDLRRMAESLR